MENSAIELWELPFQSKAINVIVMVIENDINFACNEANHKNLSRLFSTCSNSP